ncbi:MAG TPA: SDR family oxidoreductase [Bryocella sp.]|nr:SDR family oxidoreductase [Bryocella sp.]
MPRYEDSETNPNVDGSVKTALITGAGSGIGAATARELARAGMQLIISDINMEAAESVAAELPHARAVQMDVTSPESIRKALESIARLDVLVNNAGIGLVGDIAHTSLTDFERVMHVNVTSVFLVTQLALELLVASRGSIVNIASVAGLVGIRQRFAYCASKGAVVAMTRQLAVEYPDKLRVNCICPGTIDSPFVAGYLAKYHAGEEEKVREELSARQPVGRLGRPEEVAALVRYLCSPEADFMHGSVLTIDGGWTAA